MPIFRRHIQMALLLAASWILSPALGAPNICLATPLMAVAKRHAQLSLWIYNSLDAAKARIKAGARWKDKDFPMQERVGGGVGGR